MVGCREPDPERVTKTIGPAGGLISSHDDVLTLVFQPGALGSDTEIEVFPSDEPPPIFGPAYRVRPDIPLAVDVEVTYRRVLPSNPNAATVGAIRLDDYTEQMGYWRPLSRLALNPEQQSVISADDELSLYYGLLEDASAPPLPTDDGGDDPPPGDDDGTTGTSAGSMDTSATDGGSTTSPVDPSEGVTTEPPPDTDSTTNVTTEGQESSGSSSGGMGMDDGMVMPICGDGMPQAGELCLAMGVDYAAGLDPIDVGLGDFDGNATLDVVTLDAGTLEVGLVPGNGDGTLGMPAGGFAVGAMPIELAVADFTGEGQLDVVVLDAAINSLGLLAGDGAGGFAAPVATAAGAGLVDLSVADFDGNAAADLGVLNATDGTVQMILGGAGMLVAGPVVGVMGGADATVGTGDLNAAADAFDDIIAVGGAGYHAWATDGTGMAFVGDVTGAFGPGGTFSEVVVGDINVDGNPDVAGLDVATGSLVVGLSNGAAAMFNFGTLAVGTTPSDVVLADLDGDTDLDVVVCNQGSDDVMIFAWDAGAYVPAFTFPTGVAPSGVAVGELDGDGVPDVVVSNEGSDSVTVILSDP